MTHPAHRIWSYLEAGRLEQADDLVRDAFAEEPESVLLWYVLACLRRAQGRLPEALVAAGHAITRAPDVHLLHEFASIVLSELGRYDDAVRAAREAVRLEPTSWSGHARLALAASRFAGRRARQEARTAASRALELAPDEPHVHLAAGRVAESGGHYREAERALRLGLALAPNLPHLHERLGQVLIRQGRWWPAVTRLVTAVRADPASPWARVLAAEAARRALYQVFLLVLIGWAFALPASVAALLDPAAEPVRLVVGAAVVLCWFGYGVRRWRPLPHPVRWYLRCWPTTRHAYLVLALAVGTFVACLPVLIVAPGAVAWVAAGVGLGAAATGAVFFALTKG